MNAALIGLQWAEYLSQDEKFEKVTLNSERDLADFDLIIWNPIGLPTDFSADHSRNLSVSSYQNLKKSLKKHFQELSEFFHSGKTLVILLPPPSEFAFAEEHAFDKKTMPVTDLLPLNQGEKVSTVASTGTNITVRTNSDAIKIFSDFMKTHMQYKAYFAEVIGEPFMFSNANKPLASLLKRDEGRILFLPHIILDKINLLAFVNQIKKLTTELNSESKDKTEIQLSNWASNFLLPNESETVNKIIELEKKNEELIINIGKEKALLNSIISKKYLFAGGTGDALVDQVMLVFKEMGIPAVNGPEGRDDLILELGGRPAVVEIKGKKKSAAEEDAAQLEKWVSGYYEKNKVEPKGILIINAFKDLPLSERNDPAFPNQMIDYATRKQQCLITTTQLLQLSLLANSEPKKGKLIIESLLKTVGVYDSFSTECQNLFSTSIVVS